MAAAVCEARVRATLQQQPRHLEMAECHRYMQRGGLQHHPRRQPRSSHRGVRVGSRREQPRHHNPSSSSRTNSSRPFCAAAHSGVPRLPPSPSARLGSAPPSTSSRATSRRPLPNAVISAVV